MTARSKPFSDRLDGRTAIVTGSGRNIGRAIAIELAERGAAVVINGHSDQARLDGVVAEIRAAGGKAIPVMADVSRDEDVKRLVEAAVAGFGGVDIVVSNVAIRRMQPFLEITPEQWDNIVRTNLSASFYLSRHAIPYMLARNWGRLVFISGFDSFFGHVPFRAHSVAAKFGLHGLAKALAREFGAHNITANTVAPGAIDTERDWSQYAHQDKARIEAEIPSHRFGDPFEVAAAVAFLCSEGGGFVSGQATHVNGGQFMI
jgi:3-oxoacyl-[acyl-carrier protein] reductase